MLLNLTAIERGSPSLVGRGIANPMFERTRGFESHSPRHIWGFLSKLFSLNDRSIPRQQERTILDRKPKPKQKPKPTALPIKTVRLLKLMSGNKNLFKQRLNGR